MVNLRLYIKEHRLQRHWTQKQLAELLGTTTTNICRWERGTTKPSIYFQEKLCTVFETNREQYPNFLPKDSTVRSSATEDNNAQSYLLDPALPLSPEETRYYIDRKKIFNQLIDQLCTDGYSSALVGFPGIGKTTLACILAHDSRIQRQFKDGVLWANLGLNPKIQSTMNRWGHLLGLLDTERITTIEDQLHSIHQHLMSCRMLLILDDAWDLTDVALHQLWGSTLCALAYNSLSLNCIPFCA